MSLSLKKLAGETMIYGASTMLGRLLNWFLMPFYIRTLTTYEYGVVVNFYAVISVLLVVLTYGLETGFFRFSGKGYQENSIFKTLISLLAITSGTFVLLGFFLNGTVSDLFYGGDHALAILLVFLILGIDSFIALPFARLRLKNRPVKFGIIKLVNIGSNIFFNLLFLLLIPYLIKQNILEGDFVLIYQKFNGVFYVFLSNALSSVITFLLLIPQIFHIGSHVDFSILKPIMVYSLPVLFVGITGMITQNIDKILLPALLKNSGFSELAVYGANFKIGVLMSLFTQSFRFAFEPFFFKNKEKGMKSYALVMDYFIFFGLIIFLGVTLFLDVINIVLTQEYIAGNNIIPVILLALLFYGIYFNLSLWYKLTDKTWIGAIFGTIGAGLTVILNILLVPEIGVLGSAIALLVGYFVMMVVSWIIGHKHYPVPYQPRKYLIYFVLAAIVFFAAKEINIEEQFFSYLFKAVIFALFIGSFFVIKRYDKDKISQPE
ncbi:lipopolysaccharide biosynthesis protein [Marinilabilia rubra]|uniref:Polysaccharide biosynthesis protein n=1 Tax=Marinilabilia rubra TaxID=2162893 RepID=A0A2U2B9K6_9BACT|nr:polysaccharide biosynthesis C-terminal domain-containing protein [Marinilabilia rubra]PWD99737.1 polysaccharide biosynthesis protein [Marinilabilia rubra]